MDHKQFVASLSIEDRKRLTEKSDVMGLVPLVIHFGLLGLCGWAIWTRVPGWPALMVVQGVLLVFLFSLQHEASHRTAFKTKWINTAAAHMCGFIILLPAEWFRLFHFAHHRFTQDPLNDPELATPKPKTRRQYLWVMSGLPRWWMNVKILTGNAFGRISAPYIPKQARLDVRNESRMMLMLYSALIAVSASLESTLLLEVWVIPMLLGQPFLRFYLLAEHGGRPHTDNMLENSRTMRTNALIRALAWQMPYHAEHHSLPAVPFHRLADFHQMTDPHIVAPQQGYVAFHMDFVKRLGA